MPGRFLEISLATQDVASTLAYYEALGFVQASVGEAWPHPYAVVTDGRLSLGLHGIEPQPPRLTFVTPGLRERLESFTAAGIEILHSRLDDLSLNEATLSDPDGTLLRLVEARTFSPPALDPRHESRLGYFDALAIGSTDPVARGRFWEQVGFVAFDDEQAPATRVVVASRDLNIALHAFELPSPVLVFTAPDAPARVAELRERGYGFARRLPAAFASTGAGLLLAPDGVQVLLAQSDA